MGYLDQHLVAWYDCSESGTIQNLAPRTHSTLNATGTGLTSSNIVDTPYGKGLRFNGTNEFATVGNTSDIQFGSGSFSIAVYFKSDDNIYGKYLVNKRPFFSLGYTFLIDSANSELSLKIGDGTDTYQIKGFTDVIDGGYHLGIAAVNGRDSVKLYLDGEDDTDIATASGTLADVDSTDDSTDLLIGKYSTSFYGGIIGMVMIFNSALSNLQCADLNARLRNGSL